MGHSDSTYTWSIGQFLTIFKYTLGIMLSEQNTIYYKYMAFYVKLFFLIPFQKYTKTRYSVIPFYCPWGMNIRGKICINSSSCWHITTFYIVIWRWFTDMRYICLAGLTYCFDDYNVTWVVYSRGVKTGCDGTTWNAIRVTTLHLGVANQGSIPPSHKFFFSCSGTYWQDTSFIKNTST